MREFLLKAYTVDEANTCKEMGLEEVVRCKKCKHRHLTGICVNIDGACFRNYVADDWFCADGERRMDDGRC